MTNSQDKKTAFQGGGEVMLDSKIPTVGVLSRDAGTKSYRCYFIDGNDRIQSYEQIECGDDAQAALKAQTLLAASHFTSTELWSGKRIVGKWSNTRTTERR